MPTMRVEEFFSSVNGGIVALLGTIVVALFSWLGISKGRLQTTKDAYERSWVESQASEKVEWKQMYWDEHERYLVEKGKADAGAMMVKRQRDIILGLLDTINELDTKVRHNVGRWVHESSFAEFDDRPLPRPPKV